MRVLLVNTSERIGGAAIAASRLKDALNRQGVEARMLVRDKQSEQATTLVMPRRLRLRWAFVWERLCIWVANGFSRRNLWAVDIANAGADITSLPAFREADVVHLHWVNQGLLSTAQLSKILRSGKPVVWTMHDMWPFTGICHHARECEHFQSHCHDCPQLLRPARHDLSYQTFECKRRAYALSPIAFVACSEWLTTEARRSALLSGQRITTIPNTYDAQRFHPASKTAARWQLGLPEHGRLLLFACQKVTNVRKGIDVLMEALVSPRLRVWQEQLTLVVVGEMAERVTRDVPFAVHPMGYVSDETQMAALYQAVDAFVTPSLEENLPNTIMEAMACGTPCVGFRVGGIPEMIDHKVNGYVACYRDADDLAAGVDYVLSDDDRRLSEAAAEKATSTWNEDAVVKKYIHLYKSLFAK